MGKGFFFNPFCRWHAQAHFWRQLNSELRGSASDWAMGYVNKSHVWCVPWYHSAGVHPDPPAASSEAELGTSPFGFLQMASSGFFTGTFLQSVCDNTLNMSVWLLLSSVGHAWIIRGLYSTHTKHTKHTQTLYTYYTYQLFSSKNQPDLSNCWCLPSQGMMELVVP